MGPDFALQARYRVRSGDREHALLLAAEKRGNRLVVVGLDPLGTELFAVVQEDGAVRRERHLRPLFPFAPENALRDLVEARFPAALDALGPASGGGARRSVDRTTVHLSRQDCGWNATVELPPEAPVGDPADRRGMPSRVHLGDVSAPRKG